MLGHLSNENNFPELAYKSVLEQVEHKDINLNIASRLHPSEFFEVCTQDTISTIESLR